MGKQNVFKAVCSVFIVILGNVLYALAVKLFLIPAGLVTGGTTGIGLAVNYAAGIPVATFVLVFNVVMLAAGFAVFWDPHWSCSACCGMGCGNRKQRTRENR